MPSYCTEPYPNVDPLELLNLDGSKWEVCAGPGEWIGAYCDYGRAKVHKSHLEVRKLQKECTNVDEGLVNKVNALQKEAAAKDEVVSELKKQVVTKDAIQQETIANHIKEMERKEEIIQYLKK